MCGKLACYLQSFSTLRTDKNSKRWSADTCSRTPHKPLLLLSILDLISSGSILKNFIEPSFGLAENFNSYWPKVMSIKTSVYISYPFYHSETAGFWYLKEQSGIAHQRGRILSSVKFQDLTLGGLRLYPRLQRR